MAVELDDMTTSQISWDEIRSEFPLLARHVHGRELVYMDSAATSQKPECVIQAEDEFYRTINSGVHRGAHELASLSTMAYEDARGFIAQLIGANYGEGFDEIVVTAGATAGLNMLATSLGYASSTSATSAGGTVLRTTLGQPFSLAPGDEIVVSRAEHHSVLLPFQELARRTGATFKWLDVDVDGRIITEPDVLDSVITEHTKIVAFTHISNVTGAITDVAPIVARAHKVGAFVVLDMCQSVPHIPIDVHALDVDFAVFSAHKMYGPTGVGFLYGKRELLELLPPANFGGSMVELAWMDKPAQYMVPPARFEAGTQPVAQVIATGRAAQWMMAIGMDRIYAHELELTEKLLSIGDIDGVRILGPTHAHQRIGTVAFEVAGVHPHDVGQFLDARAVAIRVGHHCAQPIHRHFGVYASNRASLGVYNNSEDIEIVRSALSDVRSFFNR